MGDSVAYLDTQVVVWLAAGDVKKLSRAAKVKLRQPLKISPIVVLELEYLFEVHRLSICANDIVGKVTREMMMTVCEAEFSSVIQAGLAEKWTRDPFDRIIVAQAKTNGFAPLISADDRIRQNYRRTVW